MTEVTEEKTSPGEEVGKTERSWSGAGCQQNRKTENHRKTTLGVPLGCFPGEFGHKEVPSGNSRNRNPKETFSRKNDNHCQPEPILAGLIE
jgi:hypothetical protein